MAGPPAGRPEVLTAPGRRAALRLGVAEVHVLAVVHGLVAEARLVERAFDEVGPDAVGVGLPAGELEALEAHLAGDDLDEEGDEVTLDPAESYAVGLARFGDIALPPPDLLAAIVLARERGLDAVPIDLDGTQYDEVFAANVGPFALFRYGRRLRQMGKRPPEADDPVAFATAWDARIRALRGFDAVERAREKHMALRLEDLATRHRRVLAVVDVTRAAGVVGGLVGRGAEG